MCGIAGILDRRGDAVMPSAARRMADAIVHRGPDGAGVWAKGPVGLANRRLAILDRSTRGHMPMHSEGSRHVLTYSGEVYNHVELRNQLADLGHRFDSYTDTEVVLRAYEQWGPKCVERFNGMFAFALWDADKRALFLARDRYGIKPLYWGLAADGTLLFGSEVKAILAHGALKPSLSHPHVREYFTFQNLFTDGTLFDGVKLLPPGCTLTATPDGRRPVIDRYWDFAFEEPTETLDPREYEEELDRLFRQAVQRQLVADVAVGTHLSGGTDSASIAAVASGQLPWLPTFTVGFDMRSAGGLETGADEREVAEHLSYLLGTEHFQAVLKAGDMERCLPELVWSLEDLRVGQSYPNYHLARLASRFCTVVLGGAGGDELFAGYPWRYHRAVDGPADTFVERYYRFWHRLVPDTAFAGFFRSHVWNDVRDQSMVDVFRSALPAQLPERAADTVNASLHLEARTFLHGLLVVEDKLSMAHSLENRVPFLDNDLVDFAMKVPVELKLRASQAPRVDENDAGRYVRRSTDGKVLLRKVMERYVPATVAQGAKQGFSGPDASWFRGDSIDYVRRELLNPDAALYAHLDYDGVRPLIEDHIEGRENRRLLLWSLLSFERWCRIFLHGETPAPAQPTARRGALVNA